MPGARPFSPCPPVFLAALLACGTPTDDTDDAAATTGPATTGAQTTTTSTTTSTSTSTEPTTADPATTSTSTSTGSTTDITTDATTGAPVDDCADLPLCDDFESAAPGDPPDPSIWQVVSPDCSGTGKLAVADDQAHSGARSLRVDGGGGYCDHVFIAHAAALESLPPVWYARFYIRLDAALGDGHVTFVSMTDTADGGPLRIGGQAKILMWNRASDDATLPVLSPMGIALSVPLPAQQWSCLEFMVDETAAELRTWVDGTEVAGLHVDGAPTPEVDQQWHNKPGWKPTLTDFKLGWESYAGQPMILHFDDVALSAAPIGCQ
jgi:hypothetical protein